jgi:energy-coupling factor transporter ATP-binding protein EcfA2
VNQDPTTAVFGSYNARSMSAKMVAMGFVAPPQFWNVLPLGNSIVTGPRGSGKTTLLKMLTSAGLEAWDDERAEEASALASYSGVFVAADRSWAGQVEAVGRKFDDLLRVQLGNATFVLHSLRAMVQCARWRTGPREGLREHDRAVIGPGVEEQIARAVHKAWCIEEPVGSFYGLQVKLRDEITMLGVLARRATRDAASEQLLRDHPALQLDLIDAVLPFIERFNLSAGNEDHVWAFLIDEIEFLPQGIQRQLLGSMRGRDTRIIQKLSVAPYTLTATDQLNSPLGGWEGHDLQSVDLSFKEKEQGYPFSRELIKLEIAAATNSSTRGLEVRELLGGAGFFERPPGEEAYGAGSANATAIQQLAKEDGAFAGWLADRDIDPRRLEDVTGVRRSQTIQKAIAVILLRDEFLHEVRGQLKGRSRKRNLVYIGEGGILSICENNPRLLKALIGRLLACHRADSLRDGTRAEVVEQSCKEYQLHLRTIEVERAVDEALIPRRFVDAIGNAFAAGVYGEEFDPEPPLAFEVSADDRERRGLAATLNLLIHYGAIVPLGNDSYRLAYMFAPIYRLPLRKGRSRALAPILRAPQIPVQMELEDQP